MFLKWQISYDEDAQRARIGAHDQWKTNVFGCSLSSQLRTPDEFDCAAEHVTPEGMSEYVFISNDPSYYIQKINEFHKMVFEKIDIHNVNKNQKGFIEFFGKEILPHFGFETFSYKGQT